MKEVPKDECFEAMGYTDYSYHRLLEHDMIHGLTYDDFRQPGATDQQMTCCNGVVVGDGEMVERLYQE